MLGRKYDEKVSKNKTSKGYGFRAESVTSESMSKPIHPVCLLLSDMNKQMSDSIR